MRVSLRALSLMLLLPAAAGCQSWRIEQLAPEQAVAREQPRRIRITKPGGATLVVLSPTVAGDTLRGRSESDGAAIAVPVGDILQLETPQSNLTTSTLVAAGLGAGLVAIVVTCGVSSC